MRSRNYGNEKLTDKQAKYVEYRAKNPTAPKIDAVRYAGYASTVQSSQVEGLTLVKQKLMKALRNHGVTEDMIAERIKEGMLAEETRDFTHQGQVVESRTYPDHSVRHKFMETTLTLAGFIKNTSIENVNVGIVAIPMESSPDQWNNVTEKESDKVVDGETKPNV